MPGQPSHELDELASRFRAAPGTEILYDDISRHGDLSNRLHQLKHRTKGDSRIVLVPQPSINDPNDPLRWSTTKKSLAFFIGCWYAFMGAITGPIMAAGMIITLPLCSLRLDVDNLC